MTDKRAEMVVNAYSRNIYSITGGSKYILSDRGSEFISKTFQEVTERMQLTHIHIAQKSKSKFDSGMIPCIPETGNKIIEVKQSYGRL